ncbi:hypothetical protein GCM10008066_23820 [Oxalicibacterium faecigallinarum]|uniref:Uncharacterized protein n=1 Tax=Oxalicibacterium faecigallinarum TaxID=573741 RepID=A0A8J3AR56_9BURK|nr:hypothetical protein GCM10008066_23820 [Oxalicibacterium faecigallinarum]
MAIPGKGHEDVGQRQKKDGLDKDRNLHDGLGAREKVAMCLGNNADGLIADAGYELVCGALPRDVKQWVEL